MLGLQDQILCLEFGNLSGLAVKDIRCRWTPTHAHAMRMSGLLHSLEMSFWIARHTALGVSLMLFWRLFTLNRVVVKELELS